METGFNRDGRMAKGNDENLRKTARWQFYSHLHVHLTVLLSPKKMRNNYKNGMKHNFFNVNKRLSIYTIKYI